MKRLQLYQKSGALALIYGISSDAAKLVLPWFCLQNSDEWILIDPVSVLTSED